MQTAVTSRPFVPSTTSDTINKPTLQRLDSLTAHRKRNSLFADSDDEETDTQQDHGVVDEQTNDKRARVASDFVELATTAKLTSAGKSHSGRRLRVASSSFASYEKRDSLSSSFGPERKGLFEQDDDLESLEKVRERVKMRQTQRKNELENLRSELENNQQRLEEMESRLAHEVKVKDEAVIRLNECQRIIEKRNKQLIKASERMARLTEQAEAQVATLTAKINELTEQLQRERTAAEKQQKEADERFQRTIIDQANELNQKYNDMVATYERQLSDRDEQQQQQTKRIQELEDEVKRAASRLLESDEYQILLKRCDDAEAISRGLRFQLQKEQNEKKFLKKQVATLQATTNAYTSGSGSGTGQSLLFGDAPSTLFGDYADLSPSSSATSGADLSNFDFFPSESPAMKPQSPPVSPRHPPPVSLVSEVNSTASVIGEEEEKDPHEEDDGPDTLFGDMRPPRTKPETGEGRDEEAPSTLETAEAEKPARAPSVNFFEKLTIRFKRTSPRNSATVKPSEDKEVPDAPIAPPPPSAAVPIPGPAVLTERPKMYVAKSPSNYEESSDSIFGSESSESSSSSEDEAPPSPPPPPLSVSKPPVVESAPLFGGVTQSMASMPPPPPPPADESDDDADSSGSSDDSESGATITKPPTQSTRTDQRRRQSSSANDSDDSFSDEETETSKRTDVRQHHDSDSSSLASSSSSEKQDKTERHRRNETQPKRERSRSSRKAEEDHAKSRMNEYMEQRAKRRLEKQRRKEEQEHEAHRKKEEYEKEWERLAQEERERKRKQQQQRRSGRRRPSSMKTVRVSQMKQQLHKQQQQQQHQQQSASNGDDVSRRASSGRAKSESEDDDDDDDDEKEVDDSIEPPPLPPQPTEVDAELYARQQARLRERHEMEMKKRRDAEEADAVRGEIHRRVEIWAFGKELLHMILTLDQITRIPALQKCQLLVVQSPDNETVRKAYRNIIRVIHPDKLRGATIAEQLEAKELFTVLNQAFESFKTKYDG